jgi:hypothetical protein
MATRDGSKEDKMSWGWNPYKWGLAWVDLVLLRVIELGKYIYNMHCCLVLW